MKVREQKLAQSGGTSYNTQRCTHSQAGMLFVYLPIPHHFMNTHTHATTLLFLVALFLSILVLLMLPDIARNVIMAAEMVWDIALEILNIVDDTRHTD